MRFGSAWALVLIAIPALAQLPPSPDERAQYRGLHAASVRNDAAEIARLVASGNAVDARDGHGRTPLHVAAYAKAREAMRALVSAGADPSARARPLRYRDDRSRRG